MSAEYRFVAFSNPRALERAFKEYLKEGCKSIIHKNLGNDAARKVSRSMEKLFVSLWRMNNKPFADDVHALYIEFVNGEKELYDGETGEVFKPEDFSHKGRPLTVSCSTVWGYLKDVVNTTSVYADRNGNFDYVNSLRPKNHRHTGQYSLSKVTMDDRDMSRKSVRGWIHSYISVDVVSGYWFRPAYSLKKDRDLVYEAFRNMFCELEELGLPTPGELEVEHFLMKDIEWLQEVFPFVRFCTSPTEKRAEHAIRAMKYGVSRKNNHSRGRWYAKHEAYRSIRNKVSGDFTEPEYQPETILQDDLSDVEEHNSELHPLQNTYPGMTRRDVFIKNYNPELKPVEKWRLYRYIGNVDETTIRNNDYVKAANGEYELTDFECLKRLKPNSYQVKAYWLPSPDGHVERVYLYQDDSFIGEATERRQYSYNECSVERTEADGAKMLHQYKRAAKFDKFVKTERADIPKVGVQKATVSREIAQVEVAVIADMPAVEENDYEDITNCDFSKLAVETM
jgi:hypothetical protein